MAARNVERLGAGRHCDKPVGDPIHMCRGGVGEAGHRQVVVDFIRDDDQFMPLGKGRDPGQLGFCPDATARVVR